MRLYLLRHGETDWNAGRRIQGHADIPLNSAGMAQAERCRAYFDRIKLHAVYSSNLDRAMHTAVLATGWIPCVLPEFNERHFGEWQGRTLPELAEEMPDYMKYWSDAKCRTPGGESLEDVVARVRPALRRILANTGANEDIVVASHGGSGKAIVGSLLGLPLNDIPRLPTLGNGCITTLVHERRVWRLAQTVQGGSGEVG